MMATCVPDTAQVGPLLAHLSDKTISTQDRVDTYSTLARCLMDGLEDCRDVLKQNLSKLSQLFNRDVSSGDGDTVQAALHAFGCVANDNQLASSLSPFELSGIISTVCNALLKSADKTTSTRALWVLSVQTFPVEILAAQVHPILCAIEHTLSNSQFNSLAVKFEALNVIQRLLQQVPKQVFKHVVRWSKLVIPMVTNGAAKLREKAFVTVETSLSAIKLHQEEISKSLASNLKKGMVDELSSLMAGHELFALKVWATLVHILGKVLHHGSLINLLLPVVERGFKSSSQDVRVEAFTAWTKLIDNFATNPTILSDPKRVKLVMQVFRSASAKTEKVALAKVKAWWHYIQKLGNKASENFEAVCAPLLYFCFGSTVTSGSNNSPANKLPAVLSTPKMSRLGNVSLLSPAATPRLSLTPGATTPCAFRSVKMCGSECLAYFLGGCKGVNTMTSYTFQLEPLQSDVITGPTFLTKYYESFLLAVREAIVTFGDEMNEELLFNLWYSLMAHVKNVLELPHKRETVELFTAFLKNFHLVLMSECLSTSKSLKLFEAITCLPAKVLCSQAHHVGAAVMHGTPSLFLSGLLLEPHFVAACDGQERFFSILESLVASGMQNTVTCLSFCQSLLHLLEKVGDKVKNADSLWRIWSMIVNPLLLHIMQTNEVNQGDSLEHNFDCMYVSLMYPVMHLLNNEIHPATVKTLMKTWRELYLNFSRLSAMVANAEANIGCQELCAKILGELSIDKIQTFVEVDCLVSMCETMVQCVDFSSFSNQMGFNTVAPLSPAKWSKKKQKPLGNVHSLVKLLSSLTKHILTRGTELRYHAVTPSAKSNKGLNLVGSTLLTILSTLVTNAPSSLFLSNVIDKLGVDMSDLLEQTGKTVVSQLFNGPQIGHKAEKFWTDITNAVQTKLSGLCDSEFLQKMAPLLEVAFRHSRKAVKNQAVSFWNATFGKRVGLVYPESLKPFLAKMKEKGTLVLPGWTDSQQMTIEETPLSQMTQDISQAPLPRLPGMPSPAKIMGSFLNRPQGGTSPVAASSPKINEMPPPKPRGSPSLIKKKLTLSVNELRDEEFVVIAPSPKKRRILTEHQKEVLQEKSVLPSMYNNLDASLDTALYSQLYAESQGPPTPEVTSNQQNMFVLAMTKKQKLEDGSSKPTEGVVEKQVEPVTCESTTVKTTSFTDAMLSIGHQTLQRKEDDGIQLDELDRADMDTLDVVESQQSKDISSFEIFKSFQVQGSDNDAMGSGVENSAHDSVSETQLRNVDLVPQSPLKQFKAMLQQRSGSMSKTQSPARKSPAKSMIAKKDAMGITKLDRWLTKSPNRPGDITTAVVEETRSPFRNSTTKENVASESIHETPEKNKNIFVGEDALKGARALFRDDPSAGYDAALQNEDVIPGSPVLKERITPKLKQLANLPASPVLKIQRLTQEEIRQYSPLKSFKSSDICVLDNGQTLSPSVKMLMTTPSSKECTTERVRKMRSRSTSRINQLKSHPHDDFSEIRPLDFDDRLDKENVNSEKMDGTVKKRENERVGKDCDIKENTVSETAREKECNLVDEERTEASLKKAEMSPSKMETSWERGVPEDSDSVSYFADVSEAVSASQELSEPAGNLNVADSESYHGDNSSQESETSMSAAPRRSRKGTPKKRDTSKKKEANRNSLRSQSTVIKGSNNKKNTKVSKKKGKKNCKSKIEVAQDPKKRDSEDDDDVPLSSLVSNVINANTSSGRREKGSSEKENDISGQHSNGAKDQGAICVENGGKGCEPSQQVEGREEQIEKETFKDDRENNVPNSNQDSCVDMFESLSSSAGRFGSSTQLKSKKLSAELKRLETNMTSPTRKLLRSSRESSFRRKLKLQPRDTVAKKLKKARSVNKKTQKSIDEKVVTNEKNEERLGDDVVEDHEEEAAAAGVLVDHVETGKPVGGGCLVVSNGSKSEHETEEVEEVGNRKNETVFVKYNSKSLSFIKDSPRLNRSLTLLRKAKKFEKANRSFDASVKSPSSRKFFTALKPSSDNAWSLMSRLNAAIVGSEKVTSQSKQEQMTSSPKKPTSQPVVSSDCSPVSSGFPPHSLYSPSASPSCSILKKRRLSDGTMTPDSPSPPNKRRVSFAEPIESPSSACKPVNRCLELPKQQPVPSPLVTTTPSKVVQSQSKFMTTPSQSKPDDCDVSPSNNDNGIFAVPQSTHLHKRVQSSVLPSSTPTVTQTPSSYTSTQESQLNCKEPVYPDLVDCTLPVEQVLPKLTSSMWSRGLGTLIRARNIRTIGDLCRLTEYEVNNLPIKSPKIVTLKKALDSIMMQMTGKVSKPADDDDAAKMDVDTDEECKGGTVAETLPNVDDEMEKIFQEKDLNTSIEEVLSCSGDLLQDVEDFSQIVSSDNEPLSSNKSSENCEPSVPSGGPPDPQADEKFSRKEVELSADSDITGALQYLSDTVTADSLSRLQSGQIFQAHQQLSELMMKVATALKNKCHSPSSN